jgi:hypothetical protein
MSIKSTIEDKLVEISNIPIQKPSNSKKLEINQSNNSSSMIITSSAIGAASLGIGYFLGSQINKTKDNFNNNISGNNLSEEKLIKKVKELENTISSMNETLETQYLINHKLSTKSESIPSNCQDIIIISSLNKKIETLENNLNTCEANYSFAVGAGTNVHILFITSFADKNQVSTILNMRINFETYDSILSNSLNRKTLLDAVKNLYLKSIKCPLSTFTFVWEEEFLTLNKYTPRACIAKIYQLLQELSRRKFISIQ